MKNSQQKKMNFDHFEFNKLPSKYLFNEEKLTKGKLIDDNSLFVYYCISKGLFSDKKDLGMVFLMLHPFEWTGVDFLAFLLYVGKTYNLKIENISTMMPAVQDNYEESYEPRTYNGAYKWITDLKKKEPKREEVLLFDKFSKETASVSDLERAIIYASRFTGFNDGELSEEHLSKNIFREIVNYTSLSFSMDSIKESKLKEDIDLYLEAFIQDKLSRNSKKNILETLPFINHIIFIHSKSTMNYFLII